MYGFAKTLKYTAVAGAISTLIGCAAMQVALEHRTLEVSTKQSQTIFLDPIPNTERKIYVDIRNTSDQDLDITPQIKEALKARGYRIVSNPTQAYYLLQANILKIGKMSISASRAALGAGYGSALAGALVGAGATGAFTDSAGSIVGGGVAGGLIGLATDSMIKAVNFTMITDLQISERVGRGVKVQEEFNSNLKNGTASVTKQVSNKETNYQRYRTRIVSNADKMNLQFKDARPALEQGLVKALSGIF